MLRSTLRLFSRALTSTTRRPALPMTRRATPQVEWLEDRLVPTSGVGLQQVGSTLNITVSQNQQITLESTGFSNGFRGLEVLDNGKLANNPSLFSIDANAAVKIAVSGGDGVTIDDSNGMPFAQWTTISLFDNGYMFSGELGSNSLTLQGSRGVSGDEQYFEAGTPTTLGTLSLDNLTFQMTSGDIGSVTDTIPITGRYQVVTSDASVYLSNGASAGRQTLHGVASTGEDAYYLTFAGKPSVELDEYAAGAYVSLDATQAEATEKLLQVDMENAAGDRTVIVATAGGVQTNVVASGSDAVVSLDANSSLVNITGNSSTEVFIGNGSTKGIQADVTVEGAASLNVEDAANALPAGDVTVTSSTISGIGLFGNNGVTISYSDVAATLVVWQTSGVGGGGGGGGGSGGHLSLE